MKRWRKRAAAVVAEAIKTGEAKGLEGPALRQHVSRAYPFGPRENYPYKVWLSEVNRQLGLSTPKPPKAPPPLPGQMAFASMLAADASTHGPPPT